MRSSPAILARTVAAKAKRRFVALIAGICLLAGLITTRESRAAPAIGPWVPKFKGVDYCFGSNVTLTAEFPRRQKVHALRVDLTDPDVRLFATPRITNYVAGSSEAGGLTVSEFLRTNHLQAAINANFFDNSAYYLPAGTPMNIHGLAVSEGEVVSPPDDPSRAATLTFDARNRAQIIFTNWPPQSLAGVYTAVTGDVPLLIAGRVVGDRKSSAVEPRTAFGLSADRRFLYLMCLDGRQESYSDGATHYETGAWLLLLGAGDGINMDGGGSTTLVIEESTGLPLRLNRSSAVADFGRERTIASHFGIYAKPLPGFVNDVTVTPDDRTARVTWTTLEPATGRVEYGLTRSLGQSVALPITPTTNHVAGLAGLTPFTGYYFRIVVTADDQEHASPDFFFTTTNYVTTNLLFGVTNAWKHTTTAFAGTGWTTPGYDDSAWAGPDPGLLWAHTRATGFNPLLEPLNTRLETNPADLGYPYVTYYFRTRFNLASVVPGSTLAFGAFVDDGAVFYLNGVEIYRLRMPAESDATTIATTYPCEGDATCREEFAASGDALKSLVAGENMLAVEVHNYNVRSTDITFGLDLSLIEPIPKQVPQLSVRNAPGGIELAWTGTGFTLQSAATITGPWTDVAAASGSPFVAEASGAGTFYRLRK